ncbi:HD domain-containing protein [bacterium]|nr:MAG: HD domain-containing protein [bacterium]
MIPDRGKCLSLMAEETMPRHIMAHSEKVAKVALVIGSALREAGKEVDLALLEAGALLHDIKKIDSINGGPNHAVAGARYAEEKGMGELAPLIERHVNLGLWNSDEPVNEAEIINYADKRVRHDEIVSLDERFLDLMERYGMSEESRARIAALHRDAILMEKKIFGGLAIGPESICD